jgi:hypothetical protein
VAQVSLEKGALEMNGAAGSPPDEPFAGKPELLLGAAFLGGLLLAGLVRRFGR